MIKVLTKVITHVIIKSEAREKIKGGDKNEKNYYVSQAGMGL